VEKDHYFPAKIIMEAEEQQPWKTDFYLELPKVVRILELLLIVMT
jgi:hypothetical protein